MEFCPSETNTHPNYQKLLWRREGSRKGLFEVWVKKEPEHRVITKVLWYVTQEPGTSLFIYSILNFLAQFAKQLKDAKQECHKCMAHKMTEKNAPYIRPVAKSILLKLNSFSATFGARRRKTTRRRMKQYP